MKAMCFLIRDEQKRYSFLFKKRIDRDNVGRDECSVTTSSALYILIRKEGGIIRNQRSTNDNRGGRGGFQQKGRT